MRINFLMAGGVIAINLCIASLAAPSASAQTAPATASAIPATKLKLTDLLPAEREAIRGQLPNGLKYYIRRNAKPEQRAELRLVVHAGSLQEDENQRGLAHMVEHMQFEGTPHFPNRSLVGYLESIGMNFGADVNAATTFDNTTYELRVPTNNPAQLGKAFDVLQDWAGAATFDSVALAAQRGIVLEEWRRGQGLGARVQKKTFPVLFHDSRYVVREPIGEPEIIKSATRDNLMRFYRDWYRPNLMAVVAVGDFDPKQVEAMIKQRFTGLVNPSNPRPREVYGIPDNMAPLIAVVVDTETNGVSAGVTYKIPPSDGKTIAGYREGLARSIFQTALAQRYREVSEKRDPPFFGASAWFGGLTDKQDALSVSVVTQSDGLIAGLNAALAEVERLAQYGLSDVEFDRIRKMIRTQTDNAYSERADQESGGFANAYINEYLAGVPVVDIATSVGLLHQFLPTITNDDIKRLAATWRNESNRVVIAELPKSPDVLVPDTMSLLSSFTYPKRIRLTPRTEIAQDDKLLPNPPPPGKIVKRQTLGNGITQWTLSNGIRVLLRPSTNTADRITISGFSPGGYLLDLDKGWVPATTSWQALSGMGVGKYTSTQMDLRMTGHSIRINITLGPTDERISASTIVNDLETALQLMYLSATDRKLDPDAFASVQRQSRSALANRNTSPEQQFNDTISLTMGQYHPSVRIPTMAMIDSMDLNKSFEVFKNRFRDMSDFRFVIVGRFVPDSIAPLIEQYIGAFPGGGRVEVPHDLGIRPPAGMVHKVVAAATEPKSVTVMNFYGPMEVTSKNEWDLYALTEVIKLRLTDRLRQELGGTYAPGVNVSTSLLPYPSYSIGIQFVTAPERDEELARATLSVLEQLQNAPALESDVAKVREARLRMIEDARTQDAYWLAAIEHYDDLHRPFEMIGDDKMVRDWTGADVQAAAKKFLNLKAYARFDLVPAPARAAK